MSVALKGNEMALNLVAMKGSGRALMWGNEMALMLGQMKADLVRRKVLR